MKKNFFIYVLTIILVLSTCGYSFDLTNTDENITSQDTEIVMDNYEQSSSVLKMSQNILSLSNQLASNPSSVNIEYINAMLRFIR